MSQRCIRAAYQHARLNGACRLLSTTSVSLSGHSRWSKIKHDKGKADAQKGDSRQELAKQITRASKDGGTDPTSNPALPRLIADAKRSGMTKTAIEAAISRGQGIAASGKPLQVFNVEFLFPETNIAGIIECQTDNTKRLMHTMGDALKTAGATNTTVAFMFDRKGKITFPMKQDLTEESLLDQAIEAGASDVKVEENEAFVYTETNELAAVAEAMTISLGVKPQNQDLVWVPKPDTMVETVDEEAQAQLDKLFDKIDRSDEASSVQETYLNIA